MKPLALAAAFESVGGGVTGIRVGSLVETVAWFRNKGPARVVEGYIARAGLNGTFELGGVVALDAEIDEIAARDRIHACLDAALAGVIDSNVASREKQMRAENIAAQAYSKVRQKMVKGIRHIPLVRGNSARTCC